MKIVKAGAEIRSNPEPAPEDITFMARQLVQATLPHSSPKGNPPEWTRRNGNLTLAIRPGYKTDPKTGNRVCLGYPYGTIPRLLLFWITTEALRTGSAHIELGTSLASFMRELELDPNNGSAGAKRSDARRLRDQMERLFRATISFDVVGDQSQQWLDMQVAPKGELWWNFHNPDQGGLFNSWIELNPDLFRAITSAPVPVDMRALRQLKRSPLALDLYAFVCYRAFIATQSGKAQFVTWDQLMQQLGTDYSDVADFRKKSNAALRKIKAVYPGLRQGPKRGGIEILPGASAVPHRASKRKALPSRGPVEQ
ncbi:hypothetical protein GGE65_008370 [Skermanella aerolata]|uniref:replication protein RepA n=1 Tax=Skermanella aerolata TaxID=393310 RepID=UPI003D1DCA66